MAKIIEFSGPPGVGKSTLYNAMKALWKKEAIWAPCTELFPKEKLSLKSLNKLVLNTATLFKQGKMAINYAAMKAAGDRFVALHPEYMDACWESIVVKQKKSSNGVDLRFKRAEHLYNTIQKVQYLKELKLDKYAIVDEGLVHRLPTYGTYNSTGLEEDKAELYELLQLMPVPDAFIYIDTDMDVILSRLKQRQNVINMHKSLNEAEIIALTLKVKERMGFIKETLMQKGVPVLPVDAKFEINHNIKVITDFIDNIKERQNSEQVIV